jgi:hypothetical protein
VQVTLDDGTIIHTAEPARGPVGVAVYPWEIRITLEPPNGAANVLAGVISAIVYDRGRTRVRIGSLHAELAAEDGPELSRGLRAYASFDPPSARVIKRDRG